MFHPIKTQTFTFNTSPLPPRPPCRFPLVPPPYLISPHNSPMKLVTLSSRVSREVWQSLSQIGRVQRETVYRASTKVREVTFEIQRNFSNFRHLRDRKK